MFINFVFVAIHFLQHHMIDCSSSCRFRKLYISSLTFSHDAWCQYPQLSHFRPRCVANTAFPQSPQLSGSSFPAFSDIVSNLPSAAWIVGATSFRLRPLLPLGVSDSVFFSFVFSFTALGCTDLTLTISND